LIFTAAASWAGAKQGYDAIKRGCEGGPRSRPIFFLCNLVTPVSGAPGPSRSTRMALIEKLPLEIDALSLLSGGTELTISQIQGIDEPLTTADCDRACSHPRIRDGVLKTLGRPTHARDFVTFLRPRAKGRRDRRRAEEIADRPWKSCSSAAAATVLSSRLPMFRGRMSDFVHQLRS